MGAISHDHADHRYPTPVLRVSSKFERTHAPTRLLLAVTLWELPVISFIKRFCPGPKPLIGRHTVGYKTSIERQTAVPGSEDAETARRI